MILSKCNIILIFWEFSLVVSWWQSCRVAFSIKYIQNLMQLCDLVFFKIEFLHLVYKLYKCIAMLWFLLILGSDEMSLWAIHQSCLMFASLRMHLQQSELKLLLMATTREQEASLFVRQPWGLWVLAPMCCQCCFGCTHPLCELTRCWLNAWKILMQVSQHYPNKIVEALQLLSTCWYFGEHQKWQCTPSINHLYWES